MSVASFYDMFHLEPVGRHLVEVCTNVSCALVGAQQVLEAFERELGVHAGETTEDGEVTLRTVECPAAAAGRPVVAVDHRYREPRAARGRPGDRRGAARWPTERSSSSRAPDERDLDEARRVPRRSAATTRSRKARAMDAGRGHRGAARRRTCAAAAAPASRPAARRASSRSRTTAEAALPRRQRRRVRAGHVQGPRDHAPRPAPASSRAA